MACPGEGQAVADALAVMAERIRRRIEEQNAEFLRCCMKAIVRQFEAVFGKAPPRRPNPFYPPGQG